MIRINSLADPRLLLSPQVAAVAMALSSFSVIGNALRRWGLKLSSGSGSAARE